MKKRVLTALMGVFLAAVPALAQQPKTVTGRVTSETGSPLAGVSVVVKGTTTGTTTGSEGNYSIRVSTGQVLQYRLIGTAPEERTVGAANTIDVQLRRVATSLDAIVVTALGQQMETRSLGTAQQTVQGEKLADTQRENFVQALAGRVAGVDVTSSSGVPGASTSIVIRGVSSISSSNQPLMIVDGLPVDNKTLNSNVLGSDAPGSATAFNNRGIDFTNRASDFNPEDIESITVLKGPEAAALYGIDAANGAIVITTKRGRPGVGGLQYSNDFRIDKVGNAPEVQHTYGPSAVGSTTFLYFGAPYPTGTTFYNNVDGFFQTAMKQTHNLSFSGGTQDNKLSYRISGSSLRQEGVIRNSRYGRINLTGRSTSQVTNWLGADLSMQYMYDNNDQPLKGDGGPLLGLLVWPDTINAKDFLTPAGTRRRISALSAASEVDNPYFSVAKNMNNQKNNRINANLGLSFTPYGWFDIKSNIGTDAYTAQYQILRHPESAAAGSTGGILDITDDITKNFNAQTLFNVHSHALTSKISVSGMLGNAVQDNKSTDDGIVGINFMDPNFVSVNNTTSKSNRTTITQRRLVSAFGSATLDYNRYFYVTVTGRNDWTSTIPQARNSFFYPGVQASYILSDAFPAIGKHMTAKLRGGFAEVGKDARPYAFRPVLENKTTSFQGYGYGFTGPNLALKPEFKKSYEVGTDLSFLQDRLSLGITTYKSRTQDQIVNDIRGSYGTGFILFNLNGAETENKGVEVTLSGTPVLKSNFSWDFNVNYATAHGKVLKLPNALPESYVSDTWLYGNVRNGTAPGMSTMSLTGLFYLRNKKGDILIDPTSGLPLRSSSFIDAGYDRQPKYTIGINNTFHYNKFTFDFLVDLRRGGAVFNATEHYLTTRGLALSTLDRNTPRVIKGVLRDGKENTDSPTPNNIVVVPAAQTNYYTGMSEELFIEPNVNWIRLRDVQLSYQLPERFLNVQNASVFVKGTDLWLSTNYTGLDPIVNGNTAAVGGSGGVGIDYGNFPMPKGINFGIKLGF